jgi:hypothetical protein
MNTRVNRIFTGVDETKSVLASGTALYNLTTGAINLTDRQLGVFDASTLVSLDTTGGNRLTTESGKVIIAMGVANSAGVVDSVVKSLPIDVSKIVKVEKAPYVCPIPAVKRIVWTTTDCETEYCLKINLNSVELSETFGYNPLFKTFNTTTDCCEDGCDTCGGGNSATLATAMTAEINSDKDSFVTATVQVQNDLTLANEAINAWVVGDLTSDPNVGIATVVAGGNNYYFTQGNYAGDAAGDATELQTELQAFIDSYNLGGTVTVVRNATTDYTVTIAGTYIASINFDPDAGDVTTTAVATTAGVPSIFFQANFTAIADFCHLPINLVIANGVSFDIYGDCAFDCNLTVSTVASLVIEAGDGIVVKDMEEEASGYGVDGIYRYSGLLQPHPTRTFLTDVTKNYAVYTIQHQDLHEGAPSGHYFRSDWLTILAIGTGTVNCNTETVLDSTLEALLDTYLNV